jgi:hypothetical protein
MDFWQEFLSGYNAEKKGSKLVGDPPYSIRITCKECGHVHRLERKRWRDEEIWIVCHNCELPICSQLCLDDL